VSNAGAGSLETGPRGSREIERKSSSESLEIVPQAVPGRIPSLPTKSRERERKKYQSREGGRQYHCR
jgi:hypothetical protein